LRFEAQVDSLLNQTEKSKVMELTTSWKEEGRLEGRQGGRTEGRQEGRLEGRQEGEALVILRQLRRRCGVIPSLAEEKVRGLSAVELENLADALLDFSSLPDLQHWLDGRAGK
jgi:predicted transposase YdaD